MPFDKSKMKDNEKKVDDEEVDEALDSAYDDEEKLTDKEFSNLRKKGKSDKKEVSEEDEYKSSKDDDNDDEDTEDTEVSNKKKGDMKESLGRVFEGEELSEGFQERATTLFETVLGERTQEIREELEAEYEAKLQEATQELEENLNKYLDYVAEKWLEENRLAVENGLKAEIFEDFMGDLKTVFERHYVTMPENATDLVEQLTTKVAEREDQLEAAIERGMELAESVKVLKAEKVLSEASKNLTMTQAEKLRDLVEGAEIEFKNEEDYSAKVDTIRKSYFTENNENLNNDSGEEVIVEEVSEDGSSQVIKENNSGAARYAQFAARANKLKTQKI